MDIGELRHLGIDRDLARDALAERFRFSQRFTQDDPWAARAQGADREQHAPMATFTPMREMA